MHFVFAKVTIYYLKKQKKYIYNNVYVEILPTFAAQKQKNN
jgi:hypothetical protein